MRLLWQRTLLLCWQVVSVLFSQWLCDAAILLSVCSMHFLDIQDIFLNE